MAVEDAVTMEIVGAIVLTVSEVASLTTAPVDEIVDVDIVVLEPVMPVSVAIVVVNSEAVDELPVFVAAVIVVALTVLVVPLVLVSVLIEMVGIVVVDRRIV